MARRSDQHFPETLTALTVGTPLHDFLLDVREQSGPGALVDHFVRAYLPAPSRRTDAGRQGSPALPEPATAPFLSVIVRTQGRRLMTLEDNLTSLAAQTNRDIEVIVCCHDTADNDYEAVLEVMGRLPRWLVDRTKGGPRGRRRQGSAARGRSSGVVGSLRGVPRRRRPRVLPLGGGVRQARQAPSRRRGARGLCHPLDRRGTVGLRHRVPPDRSDHDSLPTRVRPRRPPGRQQDPQLLGRHPTELFHRPRHVVRRRPAGARGLGHVAERRLCCAEWSARRRSPRSIGDGSEGTPPTSSIPRSSGRSPRGPYGAGSTPGRFSFHLGR